MNLLICYVSCSGINLQCVVQISVEKEYHQYTCWNSEVRTCDQVNLQTGILAGKLALNRLHQELAAEGFTQVCSLIQYEGLHPQLLIHFCCLILIVCGCYNIPEAEVKTIKVQ